MGFTFTKAENIDVFMVDGAALLIECTMIDQRVRGDHTVFIGEPLSVSEGENLKPLLYHNGKYWSIGDERSKPSEEERKEMGKIVQKHSKKT